MWLNLTEACKYTSICNRRMRDLIKSGQIPARLDGKLFKIYIGDLDVYMLSLPTAIEAIQSKAY